jgi:hypothetical protein
VSGQDVSGHTTMLQGTHAAVGGSSRRVGRGSSGLVQVCFTSVCGQVQPLGVALPQAIHAIAVGRQWHPVTKFSDVAVGVEGACFTLGAGALSSTGHLLRVPCGPPTLSVGRFGLWRPELPVLMRTECLKDLALRHVAVAAPYYLSQESQGNSKWPPSLSAPATLVMYQVPDCQLYRRCALPPPATRTAVSHCVW